MAIPTVVEEQVVMLIKEKSSYREIRELLGVNLSSIHRIAKRNNLTTGTPQSQDKPEGSKDKKKFSLSENLVQIIERLDRIEQLLMKLSAKVK